MLVNLYKLKMRGETAHNPKITVQDQARYLSPPIS